MFNHRLNPKATAIASRWDGVTGLSWSATALTMTQGERLRSARLQARMTQRELARRIGVSAQLVSQVEKGDKTLGAENWLKAAEVLGTSVDALLGQRGRVEPRGGPAAVMPVTGVIRADDACSVHWCDEAEREHLGVVAVLVAGNESGLRAVSVEQGVPEFSQATLLFDLHERRPTPGQVVLVRQRGRDGLRAGAYEDTVFGAVVRALAEPGEQPRWVIPLGPEWEVAAVAVEARLPLPRVRR